MSSFYRTIVFVRYASSSSFEACRKVRLIAKKQPEPWAPSPLSSCSSDKEFTFYLFIDELKIFLQDFIRNCSILLKSIKREWKERKTNKVSVHSLDEVIF